MAGRRRAPTTRRPLPCAATAALASALAACTYDATAVRVVVDSNVPREEFLALRAYLRRGTVAAPDTGALGARVVWEPSRGALALPGSFTVGPRPEDPRDLAVTLVVEGELAPATAGADPRVLRRVARFAFTPRRTLALPIFLDARCGAIVPGCTRSAPCTQSAFCEERDETCGEAGRCVSARVAPRPDDEDAAPARPDAAPEVDAGDAAPPLADSAIDASDAPDGAPDAGDAGADAADAADASDGADAEDVAADAACGPPRCACVLGETRACYSGAPGTRDVGRCRGGSERCVASGTGTAFGACEGEVLPAPGETCNGVDDDCDGSTDEGNPGGGGACSTGMAGRCAQGTLGCASGSLRCNATLGPASESCNGVDDDCDGSTDESLSRSCMACSLSGTQACSGGSFTTCAPASRTTYPGNGPLPATCAITRDGSSRWVNGPVAGCYVQYGPYAGWPAGPFRVTYDIEVRNGTAADLEIDVNDATSMRQLALTNINVPPFFRGTYALDFTVPAGCPQLELRVRNRFANGTYVALIATHVDRR